MTRSIALAAVALGAALPLQAQQREEWTWERALGRGKQLRIENVSGAIRARPASAGDEVRVVATKTARRSDPSEVEIRVEEDADGATICVVYPGTRREGCGRSRGGQKDNDVAVDFDVTVPAGLSLELGTVNGSVAATGLTGPVKASSVNGDVLLETKGLAEGSTVNGNLAVTLGAANWDGRLEYSTVNGTLSVTLPAGSDVEVDASTVNGRLESAFPITVQGKWGPKQMRGVIGKGGRRLSLSTVNGNILLARGG